MTVRLRALAPGIATVALAAAVAFVAVVVVSNGCREPVRPTPSTGAATAAPTAPSPSPSPSSPTAQPTDDPSLSSPEARAGWAQYVYDAVSQFTIGLAIAVGEDVPCPEPCNIVRDAASQLSGALLYCGKPSPGHLEHPLNIDGLQRTVIDVYAAACARLKAARAELGPPSSSAQWLAVAREVLAPIRPALEAYVVAAAAHGIVITNLLGSPGRNP